jgi:hypothetical protein
MRFRLLRGPFFKIGRMIAQVHSVFLQRINHCQRSAIVIGRIGFMV